MSQSYTESLCGDGVICCSCGCLGLRREGSEERGEEIWVEWETETEEQSEMDETAALWLQVVFYWAAQWIIQVVWPEMFCRSCWTVKSHVWYINLLLMSAIKPLYVFKAKLSPKCDRGFFCERIRVKPLCKSIITMKEELLRFTVF